MSTVGQAIDATLNRWLVGTYRTRTNVLDADIDAAVTQISCRYVPGSLGTGSFVAVDDELMELVTTPTNNNLNVIRGRRGTTPIAHTAGSAIDINPRYPRFLVREAMLDEIVTWPETLFRVQAIEATTGSRSSTIDVSSETDPLVVRRVVSVQRLSRNSSDDRYFPADWSSAKDARYPGSFDIYLDKIPSTTDSFRVVVGTDFVVDGFPDAFIDATDLQLDCGVPRTLEDVLQLGAAWRLVTGREAKRLYTEAQGESRNAAEVGPLDIARFGAQLMQLRDIGIAREAKRLKDRYGTWITGG